METPDRPRNNVSRFWNYLGALALVLTVGVPLCLTIYQPKLVASRRTRDRLQLITELKEAGIRCGTFGEEDKQVITALRLQSDDQLATLLALTAEDYRLLHLDTVQAINFSEVNLTPAHLERFTFPRGQTQFRVELRHCTLPPEFLRWLTLPQTVENLTLCHCRVLDQLPLEAGTAIHISTLQLSGTNFREEDLLVLCRDSQLEDLWICELDTRRQSVEKLATLMPCPFRKMTYARLHTVSLGDWLPVLACPASFLRLDVYHCDYTADDLSRLPGNQRPLYLKMIAATADSLEGLKNQEKLTDLTLCNVTIDTDWETALSQLPSSLTELTVVDSQVTSIEGLQKLPPTVTKVTLLRAKLDDAAWQELARTDSGRFRRPVDKGLIDPAARCCP